VNHICFCLSYAVFQHSARRSPGHWPPTRETYWPSAVYYSFSALRLSVFMHHSSIHSFPFFFSVLQWFLFLTSHLQLSFSQASQPSLFAEGFLSQNTTAQCFCMLLLLFWFSLSPSSFGFIPTALCVCVCAVNVPYYMYLAAPGWLVICMHVCMASSAQCIGR